jgi:hypothetical protein
MTTPSLIGAAVFFVATAQVRTILALIAIQNIHVYLQHVRFILTCASY